MNWDPFQRDVLAELGHVLYRRAGGDIADAGEAAVQVHVGRVDTVSINDPMLARVARAAGMSVDALQARIGDLQVVAELRGNPSAKRALWPRLREWRKQRA